MRQPERYEGRSRIVVVAAGRAARAEVRSDSRPRSSASCADLSDLRAALSCIRAALSDFREVSFRFEGYGVM